MKKLSIKQIRLARGTAGVLLACTVALTVSALLAESPTPPSKRPSKDKGPQVKSSPTPTPQWPSPEAKRELVKKGFTRVLTLSATDNGLRTTLKDFTKPDKVRKAVQKEMRRIEGLEQEIIPSDIIMVFYEPQEADVHKEMPPAMKDFCEDNENRNFHVFHLPPYNPQDTTTHDYDSHIRCCYRPW